MNARHKKPTVDTLNSDTERINDRLKQQMVDVHKEANATFILGKSMGFKFDKSDSEVQQVLADMISNDAHQWESSSKQACL